MTETPHQTAPPGPPPGWNTQNLADYRQLRRSREDRKLAGVAGGLGRHLNVDPTILRVLFVVLAVFGGAGLLLYAALWLIVPEEGSERAVISTSETTRNALLVTAVAVAVLVVIGAGADGSGYPWVLVVGLVVAVVLLSRDRRPSPPPAPPGPTGGTGPAPWAAPTPPSGSTAVPTAPGSWSGAFPAAPPTPWYPPPPRRVLRTGPLLFGPTLALIALALGLLGVYDASGGAVADSAYPALALAVTGLMLVVGAFVGRAGGLILLGVLAALVLVATALGRPGFSGDRNLVVRPTSAAQVRDAYEVPAGRVEVDLSRVTDPSTLQGRTIDVNANAGEVVVVVPRTVPVAYTAAVQYAGVIETPGTRRDGWDPSISSAFGTGAGGAPLRLDLHLKFGHIQVVRAHSIPVPAPAGHAPKSRSAS